MRIRTEPNHVRSPIIKHELKMNEPFGPHSALINETKCHMTRYVSTTSRKDTRMLFLLCAAMIISMTAATAIMLHAETVKPKVEKARVYWR